MIKPIPKKTKTSKLAKSKANPRSSYWKKKADKVWGAFIHYRDDFCMVCGTNRTLQAHHLISRGKIITRHCPENGVLLCATHHIFDPDCSPHAGPIGFTDFLYEEHNDKYNWVKENQFAKGLVDYEARFNELTKLTKEL